MHLAGRLGVFMLPVKHVTGHQVGKCRKTGSYITEAASELYLQMATAHGSDATHPLRPYGKSLVNKQL